MVSLAGTDPCHTFPFRTQTHADRTHAQIKGKHSSSTSISVDSVETQV